MTIDFVRVEEYELLLDTVRAFARDKLRPNIRSFEAQRAVDGTIVAVWRDLGLDASSSIASLRKPMPALRSRLIELVPPTMCLKHSVGAKR